MNIQLEKSKVDIIINLYLKIVIYKNFFKTIYKISYKESFRKLKDRKLRQLQILD
jgi:hypothetical protein